MSDKEQQTLQAISYLLRRMRSKDWAMQSKYFKAGSIRSLGEMVQRIENGDMQWRLDDRFREAVSVLLALNRGLSGDRVDTNRRKRVVGVKVGSVESERKEKKCFFCASVLPERTDPIRAISASLGGSRDPSNLINVCGPCQREKLDMTPAEYAEWRKTRGLSLAAGEDWNQYNAHVDREKIVRRRVDELLKLSGLKLARSLATTERNAAIEKALIRAPGQTKEVAKAFLGIGALPVSSLKALSFGDLGSEDRLEERLAEF